MDYQSLFTKLTLFMGMFFASTPGLVDGGTSEDIADTGGGDETVADDTSTEVADQGGDEDHAEESVGEEADAATDGADNKSRLLPAQIKEALSKLKESDPKAAEVVRRAYYEAGDFKRVFPTVNHAREARDLIESVGGEEGISSMRQEVGDYAAELSAMAQGDPKVIEELARDFPQGLLRMVPAAVEKMRQVDSAAYERMAGGIVASTLKDRGVAGSVNRVIELIGDGKQKEAHELATKLAAWIQGVEDFAKTKPAGDESPEAKALRERETTLNQREQNDFRSGVAKTVLGSMNDAIGKALLPLMKGKTLSPTQKQGVINEARTLLSRTFERNEGYQTRMKELLAQGDAKAIERYVRGQMYADRVAKAVKTAWSARGFAAPRATAANTGAGAAGGVTQVSKKPSPDQIDWSRDKSRQLYMSGRAYIKGTDGKKMAKWDPNA